MPPMTSWDQPDIARELSGAGRVDGRTAPGIRAPGQARRGRGSAITGRRDRVARRPPLVEAQTTGPRSTYLSKSFIASRHAGALGPLRETEKNESTLHRQEYSSFLGIGLDGEVRRPKPRSGLTLKGSGRLISWRDPRKPCGLVPDLREWGGSQGLPFRAS